MLYHPKLNKTSIITKHIHAISSSWRFHFFLIARVLWAIVLVLNALFECHLFEVKVDQDLLLSLNLINLLLNLVQLLLLLSLVHVKLS